jgi:hypothetical protein
MAATRARVTALGHRTRRTDRLIRTKALTCRFTQGMLAAVANVAQEQAMLAHKGAVGAAQAIRAQLDATDPWDSLPG